MMGLSAVLCQDGFAKRVGLITKPVEGFMLRFPDGTTVPTPQAVEDLEVTTGGNRFCAPVTPLSSFNIILGVDWRQIKYVTGFQNIVDPLSRRDWFKQAREWRKAKVAAATPQGTVEQLAS